MDKKITPATHRKQNDVYCKIWDTKETIYTDHTGKFPVHSTRGHRYIRVMVEIDANYIDAKPMKNITEDEMIRVHQVLFQLIIEIRVYSLKQIS